MTGLQFTAAAWMATLLLMPVLMHSGASAQGLGGKWANSTYEVELTVAGNQVSGTFTAVAYPDDPPGRITGDLREGGTLFVADWTFRAG